MIKIFKNSVWALSIILIFVFNLSILHSVSKQDNDLLFIISLYENNHYDLAKKQISIFEQEFKDSEKKSTIMFVKANIALHDKDYLTADSLYNYLLGLNIEGSMQGEIWLNKALIMLESSNYVMSLAYVNNAGKYPLDQNLQYQKEIISGKAYAGLLSYSFAKSNFEKALMLKKDDTNAIFELVKVLIAINEKETARKLIYKTIENQRSITLNKSVINVWLDYLIAEEDFSSVLRLEEMIDNSGLVIDESISLRFAKVHLLMRDYDDAMQIITGGSKYQNYRQYLKGLIYLNMGEEMKADSIFADVSRGFYYGEDFLPDSTEEIVILSWLERIKILYSTYPAKALEEVSKYLSNIPQDKQNPYVVYTYSSLLFKSERYQEAINNLLYIKHNYDIPELQHNIDAMLGDIWYNAKLLDNAEQAYNNYLNLYPSGKFRSHAYYNIALINFDKLLYKETETELMALLNLDVNAEFKEKAMYLLAETYFYRADYQKAAELYLQIDQQYLPLISINFRIAQSFYFMGEYRRAQNYIPEVIEDPIYSYRVLMLKGNIYFNLKQYNEALTIYNEALNYGDTDYEILEANSYIALSLYRLRRFDEASKIYIKLSQEKESPQAYYLMAAKTSYHAKNYRQALLLFRQFITEYPNSNFYNYALANIGSIYYNQKEYIKAIETWVDLLKRYKTNQLFDEDEQVILASVFTGLQWCFRQSPNQEKLDEINDMIDSFLSEYIKFELQYLLLKIYFGNEQWDDIIQIADNLREQFPQKENNEIKRYVAASLSQLDRFTEADSIYQKVFELEPNSEILTEWANLDFQMGKYSEAVSKLEQALDMDTTPQRFITLLNKIYEYNIVDFEQYWQKWSGEFDPIPDLANKLRMLWNYNNSNWNQAELLAKELLLNPDYQIRSMAQFIVGVSEFNLLEYDNAIVELFRTIYLYPESNELVLEAQIYIIKSYLQLDQLQDAELIFNQIRDKLTDDQKNDLTILLNEKKMSHE